MVHGSWSMVHGRRAGRGRCAESGWTAVRNADLAETGERGADSVRVARGAPRAASKPRCWACGVPGSVGSANSATPLDSRGARDYRGLAAGASGFISGIGKGSRSTAENCGQARRRRWWAVLLHDEQRVQRTSRRRLGALSELHSDQHGVLEPSQLKPSSQFSAVLRSSPQFSAASRRSPKQ